MTVPTTSNKKVYAASAGQDTFAYDFRVDQKSDMEVYIDAVLEPEGDWSITNLGDAGGGDVILDSPLADDATVTLLRTVTFDQQVDYQPFDAFPAETHEGALDKLTFLAQQLDERIGRNITFPVDEASPDTELPTLVADSLIGIDSDGSSLNLFPIIDIGGAVANDSIATDKLQNNAVTTLKINDAAVTTAKINNDAVTTAKLQNNIALFQRGTDIDDADVDGSNILTLPTDGNAFHFSGTQQVDEIADVAVGSVVLIVHDSVRTLTHHATNLILPGGADIETAAGDISFWYQYATGDWYCLNYQRSVSAPEGTPIGASILWPTATPPPGFLECDGSSLSTTTYSRLFNVIGYTYGGSGANFNLPDFRGEFIRGFDNGAANDPDRASRTDRGDGTTGDNVGTKQGYTNASHTHTTNASRRYGNGSSGNTGWSQDPSSSGSSALGSSSSGGNEARPRNVYQMICIRY